ncbi:hypothetical protein [Caballeronia glebae]|nr:hypothetical protein [Caballeronia glebae]
MNQDSGSPPWHPPCFTFKKHIQSEKDESDNLGTYKPAGRASGDSSLCFRTARRKCGSARPRVCFFAHRSCVVAHLQDGNALIQMFRAMVNSEPADYDHLVGQTFEDDFIENGPSDRVDKSQKWQNADR